jgi:predicted nucleic acid-binding protein
LIPHLLDTSVLIPIRDGDAAVRARVAALSGRVLVSAISVTELEGGVHRDPKWSELRRLLVDQMLVAFEIEAYSAECARAYGRILNQVGFSRRKILDRMIAAQALVAGATLITLNPGDFEDIAGLHVIGW